MLSAVEAGGPFSAPSVPVQAVPVLLPEAKQSSLPEVCSASFLLAQML